MAFVPAFLAVVAHRAVPALAGVAACSVVLVAPAFVALVVGSCGVALQLQVALAHLLLFALA